MNISVKNIFLALGAAALATSCGENAWNDQLEGFTPGVNYDKAIEGEFTLSATDYNAVAANKTNQSLAESAGLQKELKAVGSNGMFSAEIPAKDYLPAFLASSNSPYFVAPEGSKINVTYQQTGLTDPVIAQVAAAYKYTVTKDNYIDVWKSDEDFIEAFAPMTPAAANIPALLLDKYSDAEEGQLAVVTYNESTENPIFVQPGDEDGPISYSEPFTAGQGDFIATDLANNGINVWSWAGENYGMKATAYVSKVNYASDSWLVSPVFNLTGTTASVSCEEATNYFADVETAKNEAAIYVRIIGGEWEQLTGYPFPDKMGWTFVSTGDIDLSKYCGNRIQIGFRYTSTDTKAGTWEVKNFVFTADKGKVEANPGYYLSNNAPAKVLANTPVTASKTEVYKYVGNKWTTASDIVALDAADYTAMGFSNNKLENPEVYLPLYLKANDVYAVEGDTKAVVYNGTSCSVLVYDGQTWTVNNNGLQTVTGQFIKEKDSWRFVKIVGKAYFNFATELELDRSYLFVAEGICAIPHAESKTYGYLYTEAVAPAGGVIEMKNEVNAFTFSTTATVDDNVYKLENGQFFIIDSTGRYLYMSGTFDSFNNAKAPAINSEKATVDAAYVWTAEPAADGTWTIRNVGNEKYIQYSTKFSSWGCYATESGVLPQLYVLAAE